MPKAEKRRKKRNGSRRKESGKSLWDVDAKAEVDKLELEEGISAVTAEDLMIQQNLERLTKDI